MEYKIKFNIADFTDEELCEIHNELNCWRWPQLLGGKPDWWDTSPNFLTGPFREIRKKYIPNKDGATQHIMDEIQIRVGKYKLLEHHWVNNLKKSKEEYREWVLSKCLDLIN